jgi:hypothetical protein
MINLKLKLKVFMKLLRLNENRVEKEKVLINITQKRFRSNLSILNYYICIIIIY